MVEGKIEELQGLPQVDVLISEPMGTLLVNERMLETYLYARDHFLRPGGRMYPVRTPASPLTMQFGMCLVLCLVQVHPCPSSPLHIWICCCHAQSPPYTAITCHAMCRAAVCSHCRARPSCMICLITMKDWSCDTSCLMKCWLAEPGARACGSIQR